MADLADGAPLILSFDTSGPHIAVALFSGDQRLTTESMDMKRGQAEALQPLVEETLESAGVSYGDLSAIGVGVGPGNFTGIRISVAFARGLGLVTKLPVLSITSFDLMRAAVDDAEAKTFLLSVPAPRDQVYVQFQNLGQPVGEPGLVDPSALPDHLIRTDMKLLGHRVQEMAEHLNVPFQEAVIEDVPNRLGRLAHWKWQHHRDVAPPSPLYVRPADATPASDPPPVIFS
ncbi:MAG: tRNA (adenosine(37)-N6)-threonylcarbamoyltransferase complex dimerization subunit type 1 TsaB [Pseudomonadota bacterium]